jgi:hypothetical protein
MHLSKSNLLLILFGILAGVCTPGLQGELVGANRGTQVAGVSQVEVQSPPTRRLMPGELILAATREDFPTVVLGDDSFITVEAADGTWSDEETVIGVVIEGQARAYPIRLLSLVEVINDEIAEQGIAVTWCPLCFTAIVFDRRVDGQRLTFGVSGYLYKNNLVMYDHQSETLWSQALGEGLRGAQRGERLQLLPSSLTSWGQWKTAYPDTMILSPQGILEAGTELVDPYSRYYRSAAAGVAGRENEDDRLPVKSLVIGLAIGEDAKAYPLETVKESGLVEDLVGGEPVLLLERRSTGTFEVFSRRTKDGALNFSLDPSSGDLTDTQTGSSWAVASGIATEGELTGTRLTRIQAPQLFWFAWADLYPDTNIYSLDSTGSSSETKFTGRFPSR